MPDNGLSRRQDPGRRVVVTGIGLLTGLGHDAESTWARLRAGRSAARWLDGRLGFGVPGLIGCPVPDRGGAAFGPIRGLTWKAADEAMVDAGLGGKEGDDSRVRFSGEVDPDRVAVLIGQSKGGVRTLGWVFDRLPEAESPNRPANWPPPDTSSWPRSPEETLGLIWSKGCWPDSATSSVAARYGLRGPSSAPIAACATGLVAVIQGTDLIRRGAADVALCGASDASLEPMILAAFRNMKALARADGDPADAARPWSRDRTGFIVGEGAAILVLEAADHARARGILPYVEVSGGAMGSDAYHITDLNPDPTNLADLIGRALTNSDLKTSDIDHINVHGTGTRAGDPLECKAIRRAFGSRADSISCVSNKAQIGHLLGAAGAAEAAITCLSIRDGFVPPTVNLTDPDPECDLDGTPLVGRKREIRAALKLSIGFGGHLAAVVFRRPDGARRGPIDD